jgi:hypothetical protein
MVKDFTHYIRTNYITGESLEPGVLYEDVVVRVEERLFDGDDEPTSILVFESGKKLPLNQTNLKALVAAFGPHPDNVIGKTITYFQKMVGFAGKDVPGVRIKCSVAERIAPSQSKPRLSSAPEPDIGSGPSRWDKHGEPPPPPEVDDKIPF